MWPQRTLLSREPPTTKNRRKPEVQQRPSTQTRLSLLPSLCPRVRTNAANLDTLDMTFLLSSWRKW